MKTSMRVPQETLVALNTPAWDKAHVRQGTARPDSASAREVWIQILGKWKRVTESITLQIGLIRIRQYHTDTTSTTCHNPAKPQLPIKMCWFILRSCLVFRALLALDHSFAWWHTARLQSDRLPPSELARTTGCNWGDYNTVVIQSRAFASLHFPVEGWRGEGLNIL